MKKLTKVLAAGGLSSLLMISTVIPESAAQTPSKQTKISGASAFSSTAKGIKSKQQDQKIPVSENTFVIKYSKPITAAEHRAVGGKVIRQFSDLRYAEIKVNNKKELAKVMKKYQKLGKVEEVSPSFLYKSYSSADPKASAQYHHAMLQTEKAQKMAGKNNVTVAVIDTGTDPKHPDLQKSLLPGYNAANPANQPISMQHGTHVSGIIAADKNNGIGGYGLGTNVKVLPVDVFDGSEGATDASIADGILHSIEKGAKVINMSLGGPGTSPLIEDAVRTAIKKDVVVIAAAGNENTDDVSYPAAYEGVISVGSINKDKELSGYSNYGPSVDLVAPGEDVYSTMYDTTKKSTFLNMSGTSMASPVAAGSTALLLTKYPKLTPAQVEYIFEKTADDLGDKDFDTKYANGLINPVKALSFDMKKLPSHVKQNWTHKEILAKAEKVSIKDKVTKKEAITKPYEQKWIQFEVKKGEYVQTVLEGAKQYDYKTMAHFYSKDRKKTVSFEVNESQVGSSEAKLLKAPFDGTVAIGVKDVNGSFDDTNKKTSTYKLLVQKAGNLPKDESSLGKMSGITSLPYETPQPFALAGEKGDYDYFKLKTDKAGIVSIDMSAIHGLNTEISVYNIADLFPDDEKMSEKDKQEMLKKLLEGEEAIDGEFYGNNNGRGQPEKLTFSSEADQEYIIKAAGDANENDSLEMILNLMLGLETQPAKKEKESSLLPYNLKIKTQNLKKDEDNLSKESFSSIDEEEEMPTIPGLNISSFNSSNFKTAADPVIDEETNNTKLILKNARPFELGKQASGYIQHEMDEDYFLVSPKESALYEFGITNKDHHIPMTDILEVVEEKDENGKPILYTAPVTANMNMQGFNTKLNNHIYTGLQKGKKYVIKLSSEPMMVSSAVSADPYKLTSKKIGSNPEDKYEPNDVKKVKNLPALSFQGNFAMPNDTDVYYYTAKESGIQAISVEVSKATMEMKKKYPKELLTEYDGQALVIEDTNKNRLFDQDKDHIISAVQKGPTGFAVGSFKMQKGKSYIIEVAGIVQEMPVTSLVPYTFKMVSMKRKDESIPSKPLKLTKNKSNSYTAKGYFNTGVSGGDIDYYEVELPKKAQVSFKLQAGKETDGAIQIYSNGKLIKQSDLYGQSDVEEFTMNLQKGKYQIRINDANGQASITPFTLSAEMK